LISKVKRTIDFDFEAILSLVFLEQQQQPVEKQDSIKLQPWYVLNPILYINSRCPKSLAVQAAVECSEIEI
jgi:hypothetical protein